MSRKMPKIQYQKGFYAEKHPFFSEEEVGAAQALSL